MSDHWSLLHYKESLGFGRTQAENQNSTTAVRKLQKNSSYSMHYQDIISKTNIQRLSGPSSLFRLETPSMSSYLNLK